MVTILIRTDMVLSGRVTVSNSALCQVRTSEEKECGWQISIAIIVRASFIES